MRTTGERKRSLTVLALTSGLGALVLLVACANIVGLEDSEPPVVETKNNNSGSSTSSGGEVTTDDGIQISPANLEMKAPCGPTPSDPVTINLNNRGSKTVDYEVKPPDGSIVTIREKEKGTLSPGQLAQVKVSIGAPTPLDIANEILVTTTTEGKTSTKSLPIKAQIRGALLVISPPLIDFGDIRQNTTTPPQPIEMTNQGNEALTISGWAGTGATDDFKMSTGSITINPGEKGNASVTFTAAPAGGPLMAEYTATTLVPVCGTTKPLLLKGQRVNTNVTVSPASADFGGVDCNSSPNRFKTITVTNFANQAATVNIALGKGAQSPFTISKTSFVVPAAVPPGKMDVNFDVGLVMPVGSTPGGIGDSVSVAITGAVTSNKSVAAAANIEGALLGFSTTALTGFTAGSPTKQFIVRNDGNKQVALRHDSSNTGEFNIVNGTNTSLLLPSGSVFGNALNVDVSLVNTNSGPHSANITTQRTTPLFIESAQLCQPAAVVTANANIP